MAESLFGGGVRDPALDHIVQRIVNQQQTAEGTTLPPPQAGELRVPIVSRLQVKRIQNYFGGSQITLTWEQPEVHQGQISHFNVYVQGLFPDNTQQQGPTTVRRSPAQVRLQTKQAQVVVFTVQTVLKSGLMSLINVSPSVSAPVAAGSFTPSDFPPGTIPYTALMDAPPGSLISWDSLGVVTLVPPGAVDDILVSTGASEPTYKSAEDLDIVLGNSNLVTPGAVPFVLTPGVLTEDPTKFFYDDMNDSLGVGTDTPAGTIHAVAQILGNAVQVLESPGGGGTDPNETFFQQKAFTTDNTPTVINTFTIPSSTTFAIEATIVARRTGGSSGTAEDGARYWINAVYKNVSGTATVIGAVSQITDEDQPAWNCYLVPSASTVLLVVLGATNNDVSWVANIKTAEVST